MRLKVVIVEDNPLTVKSLVETIDWASLGCEVVGTAFDGESGRSLILDQKPDILLTDIRMPQCSGLDMIEAVRQEVPDCKVIIITGYDQFQYASRAIKLAVFDYILKPIDNEEVMRSVGKAVAMARSRKEAAVALQQADLFKQRAQLLALLTNPSRRGQGVGSIFADMGLVFESYYIMTIQRTEEHSFTQMELKQLDGLFAQRAMRSINIMLYDTLVAFVMREDVDKAWRTECDHLIQAIRAEMERPVRVGVSRLSMSVHAVRQTYHQARQALWEAALGKQPDGAVYYTEGDGRSMPSEGVTDMNHRIDELIEKADLSDESAKEAARVLVELSGHQYSHLRAMIAMYTLALRNKFSAPSAPETDAALYDTWFVTSEEDARNCLMKLCAAIRSCREQPQYSLLIRNAIQYINLHAVEGLQLSDVAEKLCVSSNYLSALIRKETGVTFHEHVLHAKMAVARTMLADPRILVEEVARAVGYGNYISFYNAFKRTEHMTPTEYRNQMVVL